MSSSTNQPVRGSVYPRRLSGILIVNSPIDIGTHWFLTFFPPVLFYGTVLSTSSVTAIFIVVCDEVGVRCDVQSVMIMQS